MTRLGIGTSVSHTDGEYSTIELPVGSIS